MKKSKWVARLFALGVLSTAFISCNGLFDMEGDEGDTNTTNIYSDQIITLETPTLSASVKSDGSAVVLRWNYISGADGFRLVRYDESEEDTVGTVLSTGSSTISGNATSYEDTTDLTDGHKYRYEMLALSGNGYTAAKTLYLKDSDWVKTTIKYGKITVAANLNPEDSSYYVSTTVNGTKKATVTFYPYYAVEYYVLLSKSLSSYELTSFESDPANYSGAVHISLTSDTSYNKTKSYELTFTDDYDLNTTYYAYFVARFTDTTNFGTAWTQITPTYDYSSTTNTGTKYYDSKTTAEVIADAGLDTDYYSYSVAVPSLSIDSKTSATVTISKTAGVSYRVAILGTTDSTNSVIAEMKEGTTTNTTLIDTVSSTYSDLYAEVISSEYSYDTTYYPVFMVKFTSSYADYENYDNDEWIYLGNCSTSDSLPAAEVALDKLNADDAEITLTNNSGNTGLTLTFPAVENVTYYYTVIPNANASDYYYTSSWYKDYMVASAYSKTLDSTDLENDDTCSVNIDKSYYYTSYSNYGTKDLVDGTKYKVLLWVEYTSSSCGSYSSSISRYNSGYKYYYEVDPSLTVRKLPVADTVVAGKTYTASFNHTVTSADDWGLAEGTVVSIELSVAFASDGQSYTYTAVGKNGTTTVFDHTTESANGIYLYTAESNTLNTSDTESETFMSKIDCYDSSDTDNENAFSTKELELYGDGTNLKAVWNVDITSTPYIYTFETLTEKTE